MSPAVRLVLALARRLLPPASRPWADAAAREVEVMPDPRSARRFALGCLIWAAREAAAHPFRAPIEETSMPPFSSLRAAPRTAGVVCALTATALGAVFMTLTGAPLTYSLLNVGALVLGLIGLAALGLAERRGHLAAGPIVLALGLAVLATALWGLEATGVRRWVSLGGLVVQPSLVAVPLMLALFARGRDGLSALGLVVAAIALALQPDRGVAGPLAGALAVLAVARPGRTTIIAASAAAVAFAVALIRPDASPAVPFVDRILHTAFEAGSAAGAAVLLGSALLVVPALTARRPDAAMLAFGSLWAGLIAAAALANHPTPVVGYGGSAVLGYLLSLIALPGGLRIGATDVAAVPTDAAPSADSSALRLAPR